MNKSQKTSDYKAFLLEFGQEVVMLEVCQQFHGYIP